MVGRRHAPAASLPGKRRGTHCIAGWVGLRACLDGSGKSRPHRDWTPDRPARSELLYRLSYHCKAVLCSVVNFLSGSTVFYGIFFVEVKIFLKKIYICPTIYILNILYNIYLTLFILQIILRDIIKNVLIFSSHFPDVFFRF